MAFQKLKLDFFFVWSIIFLLVTIIGFIPSFLFRPLFRATPIPLYLVIHGVFMLMWFVGFFLQNLLVAKGKVMSHRKYGIYWFVVALLLTLGNFNVLISLSHEVINGEESYYGVTRTLENTSRLVLGNLYLTLCTCTFFLIGYFKRNVPQIHKRAMYSACIFLVAPAFDRFMRPFHLEEIHPVLNFLVLLHLIPLALVTYDIIERRRPYFISIMALTALIIAIPVIILAAKYQIDKGLIDLLG